MVIVNPLKPPEKRGLKQLPTVEWQVSNTFITQILVVQWIWAIAFTEAIKRIISTKIDAGPGNDLTNNFHYSCHYNPSQIPM